MNAHTCTGEKDFSTSSLFSRSNPSGSVGLCLAKVSLQLPDDYLNVDGQFCPFCIDTVTVSRLVKFFSKKEGLCIYTSCTYRDSQTLTLIFDI